MLPWDAQWQLHYCRACWSSERPFLYGQESATGMSCWPLSVESGVRTRPLPDDWPPIFSVTGCAINQRLRQIFHLNAHSTGEKRTHVASACNSSNKRTPPIYHSRIIATKLSQPTTSQCMQHYRQTHSVQNCPSCWACCCSCGICVYASSGGAAVGLPPTAQLLVQCLL